MRTFAFLRRHKANVLIALVLLMLQAYSELTLPSIMSGIVDIGISRGGIQSVVPDKVTEVDLSDVELFLSPDELELVEGSYSKPIPRASAHSMEPRTIEVKSRASWARPRWSSISFARVA